MYFRRKIIMRYFVIVIFLFSSTYGFTQINKSIYKAHFNKADSIVKLFYGYTNFNKYIKLDSSKSEFLVLHSSWDKRANFNQSLSFLPNVFQFQYSFVHSKLAKYTFIISFLIDSTGQVMTGFIPTGLFDCATYSSFNFISKDSALKIAKRLKIKNPIKKYEAVLGWEQIKGDYQKYKQTGDIRSILKGRIVWRIKSEYRKPPHKDEKAYAEIFVIDALNGKLLSKEFPFIDWD
jgi:hypothetical protein